MLAGDVTAVFQGRTLTVTGDGEANIILITNDNGNLSVEGISTTVNGVSTPFVAPLAARNLRVNLGDGADEITLDGTTVSSTIRIDGDAGADSITVQNAASRYLRIEGGDGSDMVQVLDSLFFRELRIDGDDGDNTIAIDGVTTMRDTDIRAGDGADTVVIGDLQSERRLEIRPGQGNDQILVSGQTEIDRRTRVSLGDGNDFFGLLPELQNSNVILSRRIRLDAGSGNDTVALDANTTINNNRLDGDSGTDRIEIDGTNFRRSSRIRDFEVFSVDNLDDIVDGIFTRLTNAGIDASLFGGDVAVEGFVITLDSSDLDFEEGGTGVALDDLLALSGPEDLVINSAEVTIEGFVAGEDNLTFTDVDGISGVFDEATGILTFTGDASVEDYQSILQSVVYDNSAVGLTGARTLNLAIDTSQGEFTATRTLNFIAPNQAPTVTVADAAIDVDIIDGPTVIAPAIAVADVDSETLSSATVAITSGFNVGDVLDFNVVDGITGVFDATTGVLNLTGDASASDYESVLQSITFDVSEVSPEVGDREITFTVSDGDLAASDSVTITVADATANQVAIEVDSTELAFVENDGPQAIDSTLTLAPDSAVVNGATVSFESGFQVGEDELNFTAVDGITGDFDETTGTLVLTGDATAAEYQTVLRSVTFENISESPTEGTRVIEFEVVTSAGEATSTRNIEITAVNDPLTLEVPPAFSDSPVMGLVNLPISFSAVAQDNDDSDFTYILDLDESNISLDANLPAIDPDTGAFEWTPSEEGEFLIRIIVINESGQANQTDILFLIDTLST